MGFKKYTVRCGSKSKIHNNVDLFHFSEDVSEGDCSSVTPESSMHTEGPAPPASVSEITLASVQGSPANYTQDFTSASQSPASQLHVMDFVFLAFLYFIVSTNCFDTHCSFWGFEHTSVYRRKNLIAAFFPLLYFLRIRKRVHKPYLIYCDCKILM